MAAIWRALVPEPRAAVEAQWGAIADELLKEVGGRLWRNREAACLGLADLLQARITAPVLSPESLSGVYLARNGFLRPLNKSFFLMVSATCCRITHSPMHASVCCATL